MSLSPADPFHLEKSVWIDADFDLMGWHDNPVHAISWTMDDYPNSFLLDIDYLFAWVEPESKGKGYSFWIAPCTLVFHSVTQLHVNSRQTMCVDYVPQIMKVTRTPVPSDDPQPPAPSEWLWTLELVEGEITFISTGYTQYVRRYPLHAHAQVLTHSERGGISFHCPEKL